jgi:transcriptional regulator GlxA family with amidase domain
VDHDPLHDVIGLLSCELATPEPGQQTVLDRLLDVVLVHAIRTSFRQSARAPRWYRASADPRLGVALRAMHADAAHRWTVPELASLSGLSRAAFARAFRRHHGQPPGRWRRDEEFNEQRDGRTAVDGML